LPLWYVNGEEPEDSLNKALADMGFVISEVTTEERIQMFDFEVWIRKIFVSKQLIPKDISMLNI